MIYPTLWIECRRQAGDDTYGQPVLGAMTREKVVPVKLEFTAAHTTVRTDSAASHGHAYEVTANVVLLALPTTRIAPGDILTVQSHKVRVITAHQRFRPSGEIDHVQVICTAWK